MRITLINPPNVEFTGTFRPPINIAGLAAYVRQFGHTPNIIDFEATISKHSEIDAEKMATEIMANNPHVVGFSTITPRYPLIIHTARFCKKINKDVIIILGGTHVSGEPNNVFHDLSIDYAIVGESEDPLVDLLNALEQKKDVRNIENLAYRGDDGQVIVNPKRTFIKDVNSLPFPAWDLLPLEKYRDPVMFHKNYMGINTARGCAWDCNFCASNVVWERKVRMRSAENVVEELRQLVENYNINEFFFYDDTYTTHKARVFEICELIIKNKLDIRYFVNLRADTMTEDLTIALKESGLILGYLGVESGDQRILDQTGKGESKEEIRKACAIMRKQKLPFTCSFIIGHPGDTHESIQATIDFAKELDSDQVKFLIATPFPGTELYRLAKKLGKIEDIDPMKFDDYTCYQHVAVNLSEVSDEDLLLYQRKAYEEYDLQKRRIIPELSHPAGGKNKKEIEHKKDSRAYHFTGATNDS
jgi:radical SAM superfamily enzyme YgiQ (UPF0313 family)